MPDYTLTPNMSLPEPDVSVAGGPDYAIFVNQALTLIDQHDHSIGKGVQITPAGMNINTDLDFGGNFATNLAGLTLSAQGSTPAIGTIYENGNDLYFVDGLGNDIQITANGGVAGTPGSIANLVPPASASYIGASTKFVWQSDTNIAADMDGGSVLIREKVVSAKAITLSSPTGLVADYALTLMSALPGSSKFLSISSAGVIGADWAVDNSTLEVNTNVVQVKDSGITTAKINNLAVTTAKIEATNVTYPKMSSVNYVLSSSCGIFQETSNNYTDVTNLNITITTEGYPLDIQLISDGSGNEAEISQISSSNSSVVGIKIVRVFSGSPTELARFNCGASAASSNLATQIPVSSIRHLDFTPGAGTYTYKIQINNNDPVNNVSQMKYAKLLVYEIR